jgi:hypothetical protein
VHLFVDIRFAKYYIPNHDIRFTKYYFPNHDIRFAKCYFPNHDIRPYDWPGQYSRCSVLPTGWAAEYYWFSSRRGLSGVSKPALGPTQPSIHWVLETYFPGTRHSLSSAAVTKASGYTSSLPLALCLARGKLPYVFSCNCKLIDTSQMHFLCFTRPFGVAPCPLKACESQ